MGSCRRREGSLTEVRMDMRGGAFTERMDGVGPDAEFERPRRPNSFMVGCGQGEEPFLAGGVTKKTWS